MYHQEQMNFLHLKVLKESKISRINAGKNDIFGTGCIAFSMQNEKNLVSKVMVN